MQTALTSTTKSNYFSVFKLAPIKTLACKKKKNPIEIKEDCIFCLRLDFAFDDFDYNSAIIKK